MRVRQTLHRLFGRGSSKRSRKAQCPPQETAETHTAADDAKHETNLRKPPVPLNVKAPEFERLTPKLECMPIEMLLAVSSYLEPEAQATLALTSRTMFSKFGTDAVKIADPSQRYNLLLLLDRDKRYSPLALCPFCRTFHRPIKDSTRWQKCQIESSIWNEKDYKAMSEYLPVRVHQSVINAVMGSYARNEPALKLDLDVDSYRAVVGPITVLCKYRLAVVNNHFLLRTDKYMLPCKGTDPVQVLEATAGLKNAFSNRDHTETLRSICQHGLVRLEYRMLFDAQKPHHQCLWTHPFDCECSGKPQGTPTSVTICRRCYTDMALQLHDLPDGGGRMMALTTWRNIGSRNPGTAWTHHNDTFSSTEDGPSDRERHDPPTVLLDFEGEGASLDVKEKHTSAPDMFVSLDLGPLPDFEAQGTSSWNVVLSGGETIRKVRAKCDGFVSMYD